jgi:uncharacterized membrane protein
MFRVLVALALLGSGVGSGVMLATVIGIAPMFLVLPYERYVRSVQYLWPRYDPFMPMINGLTFVLDLLLVVVVRQPGGRALFGAAAVLLAAVMVISVVKNVPINRYVKSLDPDAQPADWPDHDPRARWQSWNLTRTVLALTALAANVTAASTLL